MSDVVGARECSTLTSTVRRFAVVYLAVLLPGF
jgi:hypothetical protein